MPPPPFIAPYKSWWEALGALPYMPHTGLAAAKAQASQATPIPILSPSSRLTCWLGESFPLPSISIHIEYCRRVVSGPTKIT